MNHYLAPLIFCLALPAVQTFAREPQIPPSPSGTTAPQNGMMGKDAIGKSIFVGHYGEVLELPYGWTAEAEMRGETEAIYLHRKSHDDYGFQPFQPKRTDYSPAQFSPMGLIELVVTPKNAPGGIGGLDAIRRAKEADMKRQGIEYVTLVEPNENDWPLGTFHVLTKKPYRLRQTYTQSATEFYFLTGGDNLEVGDFGLSKALVLDYSYSYEVVGRSLSLSLVAARDQTIMGKLFARVSAMPDFLEDMRPLRIAGILGLCMAPMLVLAFWPAKSPFGRRARLYGRSLLFFSLASALLGFLVVYVPARAAGLVWRRPEAAWGAYAVCMPLIAWSAAVYFGSAHTKRIMSMTCALTASCCALLMFGSPSSSFTSSSDLLAINILAAFFTGIVFATGFALAFGKPATGAGGSR